ncbi:MULTISPECIES: phage tail protein [Pseudoalteromonas]|uniref:phage tail protein n=4 Tax=Pseudoalteromonas TaxID=53246 RepID=UPI0002CAB456|nr:MULTISPECIES: phage tail protein [Pseudoalteromonas]ENN99815.1 antifreeze protein [Pseudoalteromonas agarivorans S816]TMS73447.1 hypothetical protein CWB88_11735 [Pseudoalteromonas sp. S1941]TMS76356.1 hypothetical protein CWB82_17055 [Pseudoalteromonas sp. S1690]TMS86927.1 hypothetical protein CWB70_02440 [Pseudoalteromonas sp. S981]TMS89155.1 hypothetical protein CWB69_10680 [Pseudoalteromonas sp. S980]
MSKVVDTVVDTGGDIFGLGRSIFDKTVGALWDSLSPEVPEEDLATLGQGLQKGIDQPRRITFGRDLVGGVIAHQAEVEKGDKKWMQLIVLINGAPIDALEEIYIADKKLSEYPTESWDYELSDGRQTIANTKAMAKMAGWTSEHIGFGQSYIFIEIENNREVFEDGISDMGFLIRGARVWDPRDTSQDPDDESTWIWSQNAVLCALHYVRFYGAYEVPFSRLPLQWWIAAINVCDEEAEFTDAEGVVTTEPRYTTNGSFTFSTKPIEVLNQLEACFAGKIFRQMGQWYVRVGAWYGNPTHTINQDDVHGNIKIKWHADLRDRANVVRATFTDPDQNYDRTDAPPVVSAGYQAIDNQILEKSISLPFVRSSTTAQRLATIHLEQTRLGEIELPLKHKGLAAAVGRTVYLNLPGESINNKVYRVTERRFRLDGGVTLMCVEDAPDLWADNLVPGAQNLTPNSDYLVGKPQPVFDVRVTIDGDGNGIIKWNHPAPLAVHEYDVEFINTAANEAVFKTSVTYTQVVIPNLQLGEYTARISAKNIFGQRSLLVAVQFSVLTPTLPTVHVTADYNQITLTAEITAAGIGTAFEWEFLGSAAQPQSGERVLAQIYNRIGLKSETEYQFRVRSVNHLGSSDWVNITAATTTVDLTEYINELPLTKLSKDAQTLIEDINTQVDRLRPETEDNLPDVLNRTISELNLEKKTRVDIEKGVLDLSANYTAWRQEYEKRQLNNERLIDASVYIDPDNGTIVNRAFAYTDKTFSEANIKIDGVNSKIEFEANRITESENRLTDAESKLLVQADKINAKVSFTEMQGEIASAIEALKPAYSWQFNSNDEDFIGVDSHSALGYVVSLSAITSPAISYNADENPMFRLRVRLHENATWLGQIKFNDNSNVINVPAPVGNDWQTLQVDATGTDGYTGVITTLEFNLGECDIDFIEVGKRGANDLALNDITLRTTTLENDIDGGTGIMAQYATTAWVDELGYQTQSNVDAILNTFDTTYKVSATLQEFSDNDTLQKANNAEQFINGAEAYIKSQITSFNAAEGGIDSKFSNVDQKLDALDGSINQNIVQVRGLELDLKNADLNAILAAANDLLRNNELQKQGVKLAIAETNLKANANDLESVAQSTLDLFTIFDKSQASFNELVDVVSKGGQALVTVEQNLKAKIEDDTNKALATAQEYTRTAIGYCVDAEGNITSENDAVKCVTDGGLWVDGPLAEYIANMQISDGDETASIKELRQLFKTVDGKLVARGGWTLDNNGRVTGIAGYNDGDIASLDLVGDVIRQGAMVGGEFVPTSYVDNSDPLNPQHVIRGRLELGDGHKVESLDDIKAQDGNTIEIERVYSVNGQTAWHFPMVDGDVYQRERKLVNGEAVTGWSGAAKIKGDKGDTPTITDLGNGSYQIQSGSDVITIHDGLNAPIPTVTDNGDGTHTITDGDGNSIVVSDGDTPVKGVDYFDGKDGSYVSNIYKAATSKPETPTGGSFDGETEVIPSGWQDKPYYEEGKVTYVSTNRYTDTGTENWSKNAWSSSVEYIIKGDQGDAPTVTTRPDGSYDITSGGNTVNIKNGLNAPLPTVTDNGDGTHTITDGDGNSIVVSDGIDGKTPIKGIDYFDGRDGSYVSTIFKAATSKPETPTGGSFDGTAEVVPSGWSDDLYFEKGKITYASRGRYRDTGLDKWEKDAWGDPSVYIMQGDKGDTPTITTNADGSYTISNGTDTITIKDGLNAPIPTVTDNGNGTHTITDGDGNSIVVSDGVNGENGTNAESLVSVNRYEFNNDLDGFTFDNAVVTPNTTNLNVQAQSGVNLKLLKHSVTIDGSKDNVIALRMRNNATAAVINVKVYYAVKSGHGFLGEYSKSLSTNVIATDEWVTAYLDMRELDRGGDDWLNSTITNIRIDLNVNSGIDLDIDYIAVGHFGAAYTPVKGIDYFDGRDGSYVSNIYKAATSKPATPTGGSFDGTAEVIPTGWQDTPYYEEGKITYTSKNRYHDTGAALWEKGAWSDSAEYIIEGKKGDAGTSAINFYTSAGAFSRNGLDYVKQTNQGWNAGVSSQEVFVHATASARVSSTSQVMLGLSYESCQGDYNNLNYAFYSSNGELAVYEKGELKGWFGPATGENRLSVVWDGVFVKYYKDATLIYTSATKPTAPVLFDLCAYDEGATFAEPIFAATGHGGERGLDGSRGSVEVQVPTSTGAWSDSTATAAVPGGIPVEHDRVTIYKAGDPAVQTIKRYNGSAWVSYTLHVHGSALIEDTLDGKVLRAGTRISSPRIDLIGDSFMKIEYAPGFGPDNVWYWYGPKILSNGLPNLAALTKANALEWKDTGGNGYFGGSIVAGTYSTALTTTDLSADAFVEIGPFGSNGGVINIVCSLQLNSVASGTSTNPAGKPGDPVYTIQLSELVNGSWVVRQTQTYHGAGTIVNNEYDRESRQYHWLLTQSASGSFTYTDNKRTTTDRTYKLAITSRSGVNIYGSWQNPSQKLSIISQED